MEEVGDWQTDSSSVNSNVNAKPVSFSEKRAEP